VGHDDRSSRMLLKPASLQGFSASSVPPSKAWRSGCSPPFPVPHELITRSFGETLGASTAIIRHLDSGEGPLMTAQRIRSASTVFAGAFVVVLLVLSAG
jgi:hypothetical protein